MPVEGNLNPASPAQSDTLVLDNIDDDQSYHDYDQEEDLESPNDHVDYDNNTIVEDICTTHVCVRKDVTENCQDPVHSQGLDPNSPELKWVSSILNGVPKNTKRSRSPAHDEPFNAAKAFCRSPSSTHTGSSGKKNNDLPEPKCQIDAFTGQTWIVFDEELHTRKGWNTISIKVKDTVTSFYLEKEFPCEYKTNNRLVSDIEIPQDFRDFHR